MIKAEKKKKKEELEKAADEELKKRDKRGNLKKKVHVYAVFKKLLTS